uniref:Putative secreted protein n=1 Tax=Anopheles marajoara TaxID=58244 RepID=A0A2M4CCJ2_9DIPT
MCAALCFTVGHCCASSLSVRAVPHSTVLQRHRGGGMAVEPTEPTHGYTEYTKLLLRSLTPRLGLIVELGGVMNHHV